MARFQRRRMAFRLESQLISQRAICVLPAVDRQRRTGPSAQQRYRLQARVPPESFRARSFGGTRVAQVLRPELEERGVSLVDERNVQAVQPRHRRFRDVLVTMEVPTWREQEVSPSHCDRIAVDDGPHSLALENEAEGVLRVSVLWRDFVWSKILDCGPQGGRCER